LPLSRRPGARRSEDVSSGSGAVGWHDHSAMSRTFGWSSLGLRARLTLLIEGGMLLLGATTGVLATLRERSTLETELGKRGLAVATDLAIFSVRPLLANDLVTLRRFVNHSMRQEYVRYAGVLDPDGTVVMHSDLGRLGTRVTGPATGSPDSGVRASPAAFNGEHIYDIAVPITAAGARLGTVVIGYSRMATEVQIARAQREIALVWLLVAVLAGFLAFALSSYIAVPITRIAAAMQGASDGEVRAVHGATRSDEIGVLASAFNKMAEDLSRHRKHLEELVDERTAELRRANARLTTEIAERTRAEADALASRQQLRDLASHLQSVREQERTDVAREIHDELGQALTALKMDAHWIGRRIGPGQPELGARALAMAKVIDATVHAVRRISSELRPTLLDDLGLAAAIEWQAREFEQRSGITCDIQSEPEDIVLDRPRSTALFRIFQETLTNVARHAHASCVDVALRHLGSSVELTVSDNGRGIDAEQASDARSLGIVGMRERARALGGTLDVDGAAGRGTIVRVSIPL